MVVVLSWFFRADSTTTEETKEEGEEEEEEQANIKSNNPHLTGGEIYTWPTDGQYLLVSTLPTGCL